MSRSKVPGYREGLNVYQTFTCPRTDSEWTSASLRMNCNVGGDQLNNHYYCIPNAERSHFVEFCYDKASMNTEKGNCWEMGGIGYLNQVNCTNFIKGCPNYMYLSERVYKIPACLDLNFSERCFTKEPGCTDLKNSTKTQGDDQKSTDSFLLAAFITSVLVAAILLLAVFCVKRLRPELCSLKPKDTPLQVNPEDMSLLNSPENKENTKPYDGPELDTAPRNIKGHISHLYLSRTGNIWASNDHGKVGIIDPSGNNVKSIKTCSTYSGHFALATIDNKEGEHIYWVHNEEKAVKRDENEHETKTGKWVPISILFSAEEEILFYVGMVMNNDAKITRYYKDWKEKDDIHRYEAEKEESKLIFRYPAYLAKNINGDLCVSDNNKRVIVVNKNNEFRFKYTGHDQNGFTPYGICTDSMGCILIVDSSSSSIHIIDEEGNFQRKMIMSKHLREPRGLCIDKDGNCCVGSYGTISVYNYMNKSDDTPPTTATEESEN